MRSQLQLLWHRESEKMGVGGEGRRPSSWVLGFAGRLQVGCVRLGVVVVVGQRDGGQEEIFLKQHKKFQIKKEKDKLLINK